MVFQTFSLRLDGFRKFLQMKTVSSNTFLHTEWAKALHTVY